MRTFSADRQWLTTRQVLEILGISRRTLYDWINSGRIAHPIKDERSGYNMWPIVDIQIAREHLKPQQGRAYDPTRRL
jgi:predicted site-specific integrase-resolvase